MKQNILKTISIHGNTLKTDTLTRIPTDHIIFIKVKKVVKQGTLKSSPLTAKSANDNCNLKFGRGSEGLLCASQSTNWSK